MNIFYTNRCPKKSAHDLCIKHRNKMIVESAQMLSTAHHVLDGSRAIKGIYKLAYENHPSSKWVRSSFLAYSWLLIYTEELLNLYKQQNWCNHASFDVVQTLGRVPLNAPEQDFTEPPFVALESFKVPHQHSTEYKYQQYLLWKYRTWSSSNINNVQFFKNPPSWILEQGVPYLIVE